MLSSQSITWVLKKLNLTQQNKTCISKHKSYDNNSDNRNDSITTTCTGRQCISMVTFQSTGVATFFLSVSFSESMARRISLQIYDAFSIPHKRTTAHCINRHTPHNRFTALFPGPPGWAGARRELLDFMVQAKINGGTPSGLTSAHLHHLSIFYGPDAVPAAQPTASKHRRQLAHSD